MTSERRDLVYENVPLLPDVVREVWGTSKLLLPYLAGCGKDEETYLSHVVGCSLPDAEKYLSLLKSDGVTEPTAVLFALMELVVGAARPASCARDPQKLMWAAHARRLKAHAVVEERGDSCGQPPDIYDTELAGFSMDDEGLDDEQ